MPVQNQVITGTTTPSSIITAAGNIAVTTMYLCNRGATTVTANVFLVASGTTAIGDTMIYSNLAIAGNDTYILEQERLLLSNGDSIRANVDTLSSGIIVASVSFTSI
jgi:hypothetical protein